ncbi:hypothetical protein STVA_38970 [Allostella vacuolata]|nr:hypothetical protein STVA_38970 [Stella vacuolata]
MSEGPPLPIAELCRLDLNELRRTLPMDEAGDRFFALVCFVKAHDRFPGDQALFNDVIYRIKTTSAIRDPLRVFVTDKEFCKVYVGAEAGHGFAVPTLAILHTPKQVDAFTFPDECCIKPTHASGQVILRRNGDPIDRDRIRRWLGLSYYPVWREANYRTLQPKIIVEPLLFGDIDIPDYKIFCCRGKPRLILVNMNGRSNPSRTFFDIDWVEQDFWVERQRPALPPPRPANLETMLAVAARVSRRFSFVRVDFYSDGQRCYVGEITNCPGNGMERFSPSDAEARASRMIFART